MKNKIKSLPNTPGIYQFLNATGSIIYIGKAKNIKKRVSSYFSNKKQVNGKTKVLIKNIVDLKYIVVETEWDALLLENSLIKEHQPKYNVLLRDDKTFPWICVKKEAFPRVFSTRSVKNDDSKYYGPYASVKMMNAILDLIQKLYKLRTCNYNLSQENIQNKKFKICLEYHIGNCLGPCEGLQKSKEYDNYIEEIKHIIQGNISSLNNHFKVLMKKYASKHQFEKAQLIKEKIKLLEKYRGESIVVNPKIKDVAVFSIVSDEKFGFVNYMKVVQGAIVQSHTIELKKKLDETDEALLIFAIVNLLNRFENNSKDVLIPFRIKETAFIHLKNRNFIVPQKGNKKKLLALSQSNAKYFRLAKQRSLNEAKRETPAKRILEQIKKDLRLKELPDYIECFDNSNLYGTYPVAAMVVFKNAKPLKSAYRHYNIKTVSGPDDYASMKEVVFRRYDRLIKEKKPLPKLIIVDGGKGQLSSAIISLKKLGLFGKVGIIGIAKKLEEIYSPNDSIPLYLDKKSESLKVIQHIRNEAHRFGINHHRKKRISGAIKTELNEIKGIGETTITILLKEYSSVKKIKDLSQETLDKLIGKSKGAKVFSYFNE